MLFYFVFVDPFGLLDTSFEVGSCSAVEGPVTWFEGTVTDFDKFLDLLRHTDLLVVVDPTAFCSDSISAAGNVEQNSLWVYCQVMICKDVPVCSFEAVI